MSTNQPNKHTQPTKPHLSTTGLVILAFQEAQSTDLTAAVPQPCQSLPASLFFC